MLRKADIMNTEKVALQSIYFLFNDKTWHILRASIENLRRSATRANIIKPTRNRRLVALHIYFSLIKSFALALSLSANPHIAAADSQLIMLK